MTSKKLVHFSQKPFVFDPTRKYHQHEVMIKPQGLWLSDETKEGQYSWTDFCVNDSNWPHVLEHSVSFRCDISTWAVLTTPEQIHEFTKDFQPRLEESPYLESLTLDWPRIASTFAGLLITPYQWVCRLQVMWFYGWDCASAVVWDLSTIEQEE